LLSRVGVQRPARPTVDQVIKRGGYGPQVISISLAEPPSFDQRFKDRHPDFDAHQAHPLSPPLPTTPLAFG